MGEGPPIVKPWERDASVGSFGGWLRSQREVREISLREIADTTRIGIRYLQALEEDRFDVLPAAVFAKGFLREYAKYVGLDGDEVVTYYLAAQQAMLAESVVETEAPPARPNTPWLTTLLLIAMIVVVLAAIAAVAFFAERKHESQVEEPLPIAPPVRLVPTPTPSPTSLPTPELEIPSAALAVAVDFGADCWVEVRVDGEPIPSQLYVQGESLRLEAEREVLLTLGNPDGVQVEVNGRALRLPDSDGQVLRDFRIAVEPAGLAGG